MSQSEINTAFVMAGGGSLGAVEVGMLQALLAWGEAPAFIVGASAGAINGAFFAAEPTAAGVAKLDRIWRGLRRRDVFPLNLRSVLGWFAHGGHLVDSAGIRQLQERHLPYQRLESAALPASPGLARRKPREHSRLSTDEQPDTLGRLLRATKPRERRQQAKEKVATGGHDRSRVSS